MTFADTLMKFAQDNLFLIVAVGLAMYVFFLYFKIKKTPKYKIIDREEVERQKFIESMRYNKTPYYKSLWQADVKYFNGGEGLIKNPMITKEKKLANIQGYMEFQQVPIKLIDKQGLVTYEEQKEKPMPLIALIVKETLFGIISNPFKKSQPMLLENNETVIKDEKKKRLVIPYSLGIDKLTGVYYAINESTKPKIRNIIDSRILVQDWNLTASRYYAKGQEQAVYSPEVAQLMMQLEKQLQIELAKKRGQQQTL